MAVTDEAILKIKDMILRGELAPGDRLPPEKELSERLGLSRSSMREAVKALEVIRVLDVRRGDGTYVTSLEPRLLLEAMSFVVDLHDDDSILDLFAVRRILEPAAASLAAGRMDGERIELLRRQIAGIDGSDSVEDLVAHDLEFHAAIVDAAGNSYLSTLIESLSGHTIRARVWRGLTQDNAVARTLSEHAAIVDALEIGDAKLAEALMIAHISGVERWLRQWSVRVPADD
ncbi:FadR family transcriptional regulator [Herbiconiux sp. CPCC 205763]|uniref:FadR family transcriptional regulator n=1 Tax=Herbiconiux aconitum TaxID=2970913 RepID=A0ABT2GQK6_9MICO|nr:FadR/GntR family transcriptional regulator [Herbiconiux aconitum]MCS5718498.1 FadR family transcriptional regulator [Herbiconiux aconitum]